VGTAHIIARGEGASRRFLVRYRLGGREAKLEHAGSYKLKRDALARRDRIISLIADGRGHEIREALCSPADAEVLTLTVAAERWQASRVDVAEGTAHTYRVALGRILPRLGDSALEQLDAQAVADLVGENSGLKRESIRKTLNVLAMVFDHYDIQPNPVRDKRVKLPRGEKREVSPPTAEHVEAVHRLLPSSYRLPLLVLDATGLRVSELAGLTWGDMDEPRGRFRVSAANSKTGAARWVEPPPCLFQAVSELVPRDDRVLERPVFQGFGADRFRTALQRACKSAGVPAFSAHDLRHRRVSLLHLGGMPWARIGELVGHGDLVTTARTYTHVVADERELDYVEMVMHG
jgi:integrase